MLALDSLYTNSFSIVFAHGFYGRGSTWTRNKIQGLVEDIQHVRILNIECDATMDLSTQVSPEMTDTYVRELATRLTDKRLGPQMVGIRV